jgi:hypothetical protein
VSVTVDDHRVGTPYEPARFAARVELLKDEAFEICGALALGESLLRRFGLHDHAAHLATVFDVVEGRLVTPPYEDAESGEGW